MSNLIPAPGKILVEFLPESQVDDMSSVIANAIFGENKNGVNMTDTSDNYLREGRVIAINPDINCDKDAPKNSNTEFPEIGDIVFFDKWAGQRIERDSKEYYLIGNWSIQAIEEPEVDKIKGV